jgi:hypothetical protein
MRVSGILGWFSIVCAAGVLVVVMARSPMAQEALKAAKTHVSVSVEGPITVTNTTSSCPTGDVCINISGTLSSKKVSGIALVGSGINSLCKTPKSKTGKTCCSTAGTETLTLDSSDVLDIAFAGKSCENSEATEESITGKWTASGGTGEFSAATGGGSEKWSDDPGTGAGSATISGSVTD